MYYHLYMPGTRIWVWILYFYLHSLCTYIHCWIFFSKLILFIKCNFSSKRKRYGRKWNKTPLIFGTKHSSALYLKKHVQATPCPAIFMTFIERKLNNLSLLPKKFAGHWVAHLKFGKYLRKWLYLHWTTCKNNSELLFNHQTDNSPNLRNYVWTFEF